MPSSFITENTMLLEQVAEAFGDLLDQVVFLGGITTALLVDPAAKGSTRKTEDVDVIVDLVSRPEYYEFSEKLRQKGFREDQSDGAPICRWIVGNKGIDYIVDVMPCDESILGFTNRWYADAINNTSSVTLGNGITISVVTPVYFLATKFEAFHNRSAGNYYSADMEDIVFLLEHRSGILIEVMDGLEKVKAYLVNEASDLLNSDFLNILPGLVDDPGSAGVVTRQLELISKLEF